VAEIRIVSLNDTFVNAHAHIVLQQPIYYNFIDECMCGDIQLLHLLHTALDLVQGQLQG
jgi:hypothetical protein